jgi:AcrR family transcriptional regulator
VECYCEVEVVVRQEDYGGCGCGGDGAAFPAPPWAQAEGEGGRAERRDAAENRLRILATARALFAERGVDNVSMHEIARAVGVGQGTLYRRFAHKGLLCGALLHDSVYQFHQAVAARLADQAESALVQLDFFLTHLAAHLEENAPFFAAISDAACGERRGANYQNPFHTWLHGTVAALLTRAVATGEIAPLDTDLAADTVLATLAPDLYLYQRQQRGYSSEAILAMLRRVIFSGLRGIPAEVPSAAGRP